MCSCLQCPQLSEPVRFLLWELSVSFDVFHRHRVCLVDRVDLICSLYSWWEGFGSPPLAALPLGFTCGFISTSACGSSSGVCSWDRPGGLGFAPVRSRWGGGAAAWVAGVLAAPGTQGSWQLGQQEIKCSRRGWQLVLANTLQYSCLEKPHPTPPPEKEARQATVHRGAKSGTWQRWPRAHRHKPFSFCLWQLCPIEGWAWRQRSCLGHRHPGSTKCAETQTASAAGVTALSRLFSSLW